MALAFLIVFRGLISFITLLILARALGKQQLSHLSFFDYITGITIGSIAAALTVDLNTQAWLHWVGLLTWTGLTVLVQYIVLRNRKVATYVTGEPVVVISNGKILEQNMKRSRYTFEELFMQLRQQSVFDVNDVAYAVLENNGQLSVLAKTDMPNKRREPVWNPSLVLVHQGQVVREKLQEAGVDEAWLYKELRRNGIRSMDDVTVAVMGPGGDLYVDTHQDRPS